MRTHGEVSDDALHAAYGLIRLTADDAGWIPAGEREVVRYEGKMKRPEPR